MPTSFFPALLHRLGRGRPADGGELLFRVTGKEGKGLSDQLQASAERRSPVADDPKTQPATKPPLRPLRNAIAEIDLLFQRKS